MIQINTKIHDKFSIEFKVGFSGSERDHVNDFSVNTWIFVPNSMDINAGTYSKEQFYRDVKSNIRLITPDYSLAALACEESVPISNIRSAFRKWMELGTEAALKEYEFQVRMFAAIVKSALRDDTNQLCAITNSAELSREVTDYLGRLRTILALYRKNEQAATTHKDDIFLFADEYMSHVANVQVIRVIKHLHRLKNSELSDLQQSLVQFVTDECQYKTQRGYSHAELGETTNNQELVYRHGLLKKNIESVLYLRVDMAPDSGAMQEISFGFAAGIAMIISTLIALPFQKYLGNSPVLIFIILVIAYMLKDRIKDFIRGRFAHQLKAKYFDSKTTINLKENKIGWIKEGVDFINDKKTPAPVLALRHRSKLEADNAILAERTILYRKQVHIDNDNLRNHYQYSFTGINDILRLHINHFTLKMDDPTVTLESVGPDGKLQKMETLRTYVFHIVLKFSHNDHEEYRGFRITATRNGIERVEEIQTH